MSFDAEDFQSADPWTRFQAHREAKGHGLSASELHARAAQGERASDTDCCGDPDDCTCDNGKAAA